MRSRRADISCCSTHPSERECVLWSLRLRSQRSQDSPRRLRAVCPRRSETDPIPSSCTLAESIWSDRHRGHSRNLVLCLFLAGCRCREAERLDGRSTSDEWSYIPDFISRLSASEQRPELLQPPRAPSQRRWGQVSCGLPQTLVAYSAPQPFPSLRCSHGRLKQSLSTTTTMRVEQGNCSSMTNRAPGSGDPKHRSLER